MNKKKNLIFFLIFILLVNCSFDNKTGIWSGSKKEKRRISELEKEQKRKIEVVKIYSSENLYSKEISAVNNISLTEPKTNSSWKMAGLNLQNFIGIIHLSGINNNFLKKKIGKDKFSISKVTASPLVINDNIIFADDTGTIFSISKKGKKNWKKNIYKKRYKQIYKNLSLSIYKDKIYIADNIGFIYAVNLENGKLFCIKNHGIPLKSRVKIFKLLLSLFFCIICLLIRFSGFFFFTKKDFWNPFQSHTMAPCRRLYCKVKFHIVLLVFIIY